MSIEGSKSIRHIEAVALDIDIKTVEVKRGHDEVHVQMSFQDINGGIHKFSLSRIAWYGSSPIMITWAKGDRGILAYSTWFTEVEEKEGETFVKFYAGMTREQYDMLSGKAVRRTHSSQKFPEKKESVTPSKRGVPLSSIKFTEEQKEALRKKIEGKE